jgi:hypothetical protein
MTGFDATRRLWVVRSYTLAFANYSFWPRLQPYTCTFISSAEIVNVAVR